MELITQCTKCLIKCLLLIDVEEESNVRYKENNFDQTDALFYKPRNGKPLRLESDSFAFVIKTSIAKL